jgi:hypothetical protein
VILIERSEIGGESRRQSAVTVRSDAGRLEPHLPFVALVDARFAEPSGPGVPVSVPNLYETAARAALGPEFGEEEDATRASVATSIATHRGYVTWRGQAEHGSADRIQPWMLSLHATAGTWLGRPVAGGPPGDEGLWDVRSACCTGALGRSAWAVHRRAAAKADRDFDFRVRTSRRWG